MTGPTTIDPQPGPAGDERPPVPPAIGRTTGRRRPTGAPPPLPRAIGRTGRMWLAVLVAMTVWVVAALVSAPVRRFTDRIDVAVLRVFADLRASALTDVAHGVDRLGTGWVVSVFGIGIIVALVVLRRWRHLFVLIGGVLLFQIIGLQLYERFSRPRPYGVTTIGRWSGWSMPSAPVAVLASLLIAATYTVVVPGRPRQIAKLVSGSLIAVFVLARLYLAIDHPSDVVVGTIIGVAIPLLIFRTFAPQEVFPVAYRKGKTAHLDVGGRRGDAIRAAVEEQLGIKIADLGHIGLAGSGGSTPIRMQVADEPGRYLFAKLYAMNHVRADRWYKLGRTILYGRLEDENSFQSVRRLAEYEDYAALLLHEQGIPTAQSYGLVELTPEREYLLVMEFFDDATEIGDAAIDDQIIDDGLQIIRRLWDSGLAHRDIKPANLLVRDGHVLLIDVAFVQVRPSPWRQAVDLANMMLVLAVGSDPERVYDRALQYFTPDDIAEAFAAARGVASPSQLRTAMKQDGRDLLARFRELAPKRQPIALQRWSPRRFVLVIALLAAIAIAVPAMLGMLSPANDIGVGESPRCGTDDVMVLIAQSVPSASLVPCLANLPAGWRAGEVQAGNGRTHFSLHSDRAGTNAVRVQLLPPAGCRFDGVRIPSDEPGTRRFERPEQTQPSLRTTRLYRFRGGCVTYRLEFDAGTNPAAMFEADQALTFEPRSTLVAHVRDEFDLALCGQGAPCPGGDGR